MLRIWFATSARWIAVTIKEIGDIIECLKEWLAYQQRQEAKKDIDFTGADCHVFCMNKGEMRSYSGLRSMLRRFLSKNGLDENGISLYTFRHTFATILLEERENPKIVSELMGHSEVLTTLSNYSHVISKPVYESTARTLDRAYQNFNPDKKRADIPTDGTSALPPLSFDSSFDSNAVNFR
ncbi:MAG: tyrosine-type recombinase/integrase [Oscillospiraceae bacterium]|jgi:integrase|nr:tyrosine-type recombinase/integrase [Oscillospiraceae bacterium]